MAEPEKQEGATPPEINLDEDEIFIMGGEKIKVPPLTFFALKTCWDDIGRASTTTNVVERIGSLLKVIVAAKADTDDPISLEELSKKLRGREIQQTAVSYGRLLVKSGLLSQEDLDRKPGDPNPQSGESQANGEASSTPSAAVEDSGAASLSPEMPNGQTLMQ